MADDIPTIEDNPQAALESFIRELETYYYDWYDKATTRDYMLWSVAQAVSLLAGFATALVAAVLRQEQFGSWSVGRTAFIVLPLLGSLASTFLVQSRIVELESLREKGRETIQRLANKARANFAAASSPKEYTELHRALVAELSALEQEQSRGFQRIVPKVLSFHSYGAPGRREH